MQTETIKELAAALAKAQGEIEGAAKGKENPHFRSKYADLAAVWDACRAPLSSNGLSIVQQPRSYENQLRLVTRIMHSSGQWIEDDGFPLLLSKQDMQGLGSAITYARRYGLMSAVGIAPEDDDGNAATDGKNASPVEAKTPKDHGNLRGPLGLTELKNRIKEFVRDLEACGDEDELIALLNSHQDIVDQCMRDIPSWYYTKENTDILGLRDRIEGRRAQLSADQYRGGEK